MFSRIDTSGSSAKKTAEKFLNKKNVEIENIITKEEELQKILSKDLISLLDKDKDKKLHILKAYDRFLGTYLKKKNRSATHKEINDFKIAVDEYVFESIIREIEKKSANRPDIKLIKDITKKLLAKSFWGNDFSISARIQCANQLLQFVEENPSLDRTRPISYSIKNKYHLVFDRFSKEFKEYNDPLVREKLEEIIKNLDEYTTKDIDVYYDWPPLGGITIKNQLVYSHPERKLFYYDSNGNSQEFDISHFDSKKIELAISNNNLIELQNLLKAQLPKKLKLAKLALQESSRVAYFKAKLGAFTNFGGAHKSKGAKNREKAYREAAIYDSSLSERLDILKAVTNICNQKAEEFGFSGDKKVAFKLCLSDKLDFDSIAEDDKDLLVLHINLKRQISLQFISKRLGASVNVAAEENFLLDLAYISTDKLDEKHKPNLEVSSFRENYRKNVQSITQEVDDENFIKYIIENTGFVAPTVLENHYQTMAEISDMVAECKNNINKLPKNVRSTYENILNSIEKISELPVNRLKNSDSLIPRYKCETILKKLNKFAENHNAPDAREYIRNSYKMYMCKSSDFRNGNYLQQGGINNPRFYFNQETDEIFYVDANNMVSKSKFLGQYRSKFIDDSDINVAKIKSQIPPKVDPDKLINILNGKKKNPDDSVTLDSEEVFKYISLRVEDKEKFKMRTLNEELEEIIADEVRTTSFAFRKIAIAAGYVALMMILLFVPGFNLLLYGLAVTVLNLTPFFIDSVAIGAYNDALKNIGIAIAMSTITILILFVPLFNFIAPLAAAMWVVYLTLAIASSITAYNLTSAMNAVTKNPMFSQGKQELLSLTDKIKYLSRNIDDDESIDNESDKQNNFDPRVPDSLILDDDDDNSILSHK